MTRILHLTDIHFGGEDKAAVEGVVDYAQADPPELVVITGDITLDGKPEEFEAAARWVARLPEPRLLTPGNHDTPYLNLPLRAFVPFARYRRYIGPTDGCGVDLPGVSVRAINTARGGQPRLNWSKGAIKLEQCEAAARDLAAGAPDALRIVACHHPLVEAVGAPVTGDVHRGRDAARMLAEQGVDLILTGHVHNPFAVPLPFGDELTYAVGAGTLSVRVRGTPASFNELTVEPDCVRVVAMGWTGSHFEPYRTWALDRRRPPSGEPG